MEKMQTFPAETKSFEEGYTLLELLVVIAIASLIVAVAPAIYSSIVPSYQVRQFSNELVVFCRELREQSRVSGNIEILSFDGDEQRIIGRDDMQVPEPAISMNVTFEPEELWGNADQNELSFFPNGASNGGVITVSRDDFSMKVVINWVSGAIGVE